MHLRIARHTANLKTVADFYIGILGLEKLGGFQGHDGYDGIFLGIAGCDWHLEFTSSAENAQHVYKDDDLLVFYPENRKKYDRLLEKITAENIAFQKPKNPYWRQNGKLVYDPDGFGIVISPLKIRP